jgi:hypothetical protein
MTAYEKALVKTFMDAQAQPEGRMFSENVLAGLKAVMAPLERDLILAKRLLSLADDTLGPYWFEGSYNNDKVIECSKKITSFLNGDKHDGDERDA